MIRILTDSGCDLDQNSYAELTILPLKVTINEKTYLDGITMNKDEFYEMLETSDNLPSTSLINPYEFEEVFNKIREEGDEAIYIPVSSELSGTCQSAIVAASGFDNVDVVDSLNVSYGQAILALYALRLVKEGLSRKEIVSRLNEVKTRIRFFAVVDTLKYLEKGGRLSKGAAVIGGLIGLKPILAIEEGRLVALGKARGSKGAYRKMMEQAQTSEVDKDYPVFICYSGTSDQKLKYFLEVNEEELKGLKDQIEYGQLGTAVGTHAGPGTVILTFVAK